MNAHAGAEPLPSWLSQDLYPFASHYAEIAGGRVHYVDEGTGPPLLLLHGNPTWSFLYRESILALRDRFRCIALDYPGFGLSSAPSGYGYLPAEHVQVLERFILELDLRNVTMMVQDWGGPIGFAAATRHPERFAAFVIGNTWAWPKNDPGTQAFSRILGSRLGEHLIMQRNVFVEKILPGGVRRTKLSEPVMAAYRGPFPTPDSRRPLYVFPREILRSRPFLAEIERGLRVLSDPSRAAGLADQGRRVPRARTQTVGRGLPRPHHGDTRARRPLHPGGLARGDHRGDPGLERGTAGLSPGRRGGAWAPPVVRRRARPRRRDRNRPPARADSHAGC
jgi:haloalkane dehalogenase